MVIIITYIIRTKNKNNDIFNKLCMLYMNNKLTQVIRRNKNIMVKTNK